MQVTITETTQTQVELPQYSREKYGNAYRRINPDGKVDTIIDSAECCCVSTRTTMSEYDARQIANGNRIDAKEWNRALHDAIARLATEAMANDNVAEEEF